MFFRLLLLADCGLIILLSFSFVCVLSTTMPLEAKEIHNDTDD